MMFHYPRYRSDDTQLIQLFIQRFPLALVTTFADGKWQGSHIPLFRSKENSNELFGHVDASNEQFNVAADQSVYVVFSGPNVYIPPEAYKSKQLPTWNYLCVHVTGTLSVDNDPDRNFKLLQETAFRLQGTPSEFRVSGTDQRVQKWIGSIRGLRLKIEEIEGRFKLSQDKNADDQIAAAHYFSDMIRSQMSPDLLLSFTKLHADECKDIQP